MDDLNFEELQKLLTAHEPEELRTSYVLTPDSTTRVLGSGVPLLTGGPATPTATGLFLPSSAGASPSDDIGVYVLFSEYAGDDFETRTGLSLDDVIDHLSSKYPRLLLILSLSLLGRAGTEDWKQRDIATYYEKFLNPDMATRLHNIMSVGQNRVLLARQGLLASMRHVFLYGQDNDPSPAPQSPSDVHAIMLSHAIGDRLGAGPKSGETFGGYPEELVMEMIRLGLLYETDDAYAVVDRHARLWLDYGENLQKHHPRLTPKNLLKEATGLEIEDILALGFGLIAHAMNWNPGEVHSLRPDMGSGMDPADIELFHKLVTDDMDGLAARFKGREGAFDYLPIQTTPVLRHEGGLLVLDLPYLWERVTSGLYWLVHDYERDHHGDKARDVWTHVYGEMVELMAEDEIKTMAPIIFGDAGGETFFTEEDFKSAYGADLVDVSIHLGSAVVLFEIVSGQLTVDTRVHGKIDGLKKDIDKLVMKKVRQLSRAADELRADEQKLTGFPPTPDLRVIPVVVVGGGFPNQPFITQYVNECIREEGLLKSVTTPLAIISLQELELLEGMAEQGLNVADVIVDWKGSQVRDRGLKNFIIKSYTGRSFRPTRMQARVEPVFKDVIARLKLAQE